MKLISIYILGNLIQSLLGEDGEENGPLTPAMTPVMTPMTPSSEQRNLSQVDLD